MTETIENSWLFQAELRPHRSMTRDGVHRVMVVFALFWVPFALLFLFMGAWPIVGFMGLEVLALYGLFRLSLARGREVEEISVNLSELVVDRTDHWGRRSSWTFQPQWLQVLMDNPPTSHSRLVLRSHGRSVVIGRFLTPDQRLEVAEKLRQVLADLRDPDSTRFHASFA